MVKLLRQHDNWKKFKSKVSKKIGISEAPSAEVKTNNNRGVVCVYARHVKRPSKRRTLVAYYSVYIQIFKDYYSGYIKISKDDYES